jgi:uncharacterized protein
LGAPLYLATIRANLKWRFIIAWMIERRVASEVVALLDQVPAVALLGPRQAGKTTLALEIAAGRPLVYLDLESATDRARLTEPELYFADHSGELVILDEIQRVPGLFETLRGVIDKGRREGSGTGRFLLLGSAAIDLLAQSGESLAGRIAFVELAPLDITEVSAAQLDRLWIRGGFPDSFLAGNDAISLRWREDFISTYLERDIPQLGPRIPAETLRRLWTMFAHHQGGLLNAAQLARGLGVSGPTIAHYLDLMVDLLLVRRLAPRLGNAGKRLVRSPKVYVRDSGLVHALLGLADKEAVLGHRRGKLGGHGDREPTRGGRGGRGSSTGELLPDKQRRGDRPHPQLARRRGVGSGDQAQPHADARARLSLRPR